MIDKNHFSKNISFSLMCMNIPWNIIPIGWMILFLLIQENIVRKFFFEKIIYLFRNFQVLSASSDATIKLWNAPKGTCMSTLRTHKVEKEKLLFYFLITNFYNWRILLNVWHMRKIKNKLQVEVLIIIYFYGMLMF